MNTKNLLGLLGCLLACSCSGAYLEEGEELEDVAVETEAIGEPTCATMAPDWSRWGVVKDASPVTYGRTGCRNAMIIDVANFGGVPGGGSAVQTTWTGGMPKNENDCLGTSVRTDVYVYQAPAYVPHSTQTVRGRWNSKGIPECHATKTLHNSRPG